MSTETRKRLLVGNSPKLALLHNHVVKPFHPATPANKRGECTPDHQRLPLSVGVTEWILPISQSPLPASASFGLFVEHRLCTLRKMPVACCHKLPREDKIFCSLSCPWLEVLSLLCGLHSVPVLSSSCTNGRPIDTASSQTGDKSSVPCFWHLFRLIFLVYLLTFQKARPLSTCQLPIPKCADQGVPWLFSSEQGLSASETAAVRRCESP